MKKALFLILWVLATPLFAEDPTFEEVYADRPIPSWFNEAKFGIFVVWGPYSVPSYRNSGYAEWYWKDIERSEDSKAFHERVYGADFQYEQYVDQFTAELWDPDFWCKLFADSGAKYVVTTANYHDGFAMYPTDYAKTASTDEWNSMVAGPKRDIIGELNTAGDKLGLKMGIYYSLYEWYHPLWLQNKEQFATEWLAPKFKEVVSKYKPWHIFLDGEWAMTGEQWKTPELAHWLYNESPVKDTVVVNDRWGSARGEWGDVFESEYGGGNYTTPEHPWQEDRGIGKSYGYNRSESIYDYDSRDELIRMFSGVVGGGGNFLLCVGPTADGRIPVIMQERLLQVGDWLKVNGEAVYGSTASPFWPRQFEWGTISEKPGKLFLHIHDPNLGKLQIKGLQAETTRAQLLHKKGAVDVAFESGKDTLNLAWPSHLNDAAVTVIQLDLAEGYKVDKTPRQFESGSIEFNCWAMELHGTTFNPRYQGAENRLFMMDWTDPKEYLTAKFIIEEPGEYTIELIYSALLKGKEVLNEAAGDTGVAKKVKIQAGSFTLALGDHEQTVEIQNTGSNNRPFPVKAGNLVFKTAGTKACSIKPIDDGHWTSFAFQGIKLVKIK